MATMDFECTNKKTHKVPVNVGTNKRKIFKRMVIIYSIELAMG